LTLYCPPSSISFSSSALPLSFSFTHTPTTEIYTLSLHDALPIFFAFTREVDVVHRIEGILQAVIALGEAEVRKPLVADAHLGVRSEEHTSELQSRENLVCRLLLEKKKKKKQTNTRGT